MPSIEVGADVRKKRALNCWPWVWSLTPFARRRNPLACGDDGGVADHRDQIAMAASPCPQHAETVFAIVERDTLDKARQYFRGRWFLRWLHLLVASVGARPTRVDWMDEVVVTARASSRTQHVAKVSKASAAGSIGSAATGRGNQLR